MRQKFPLIYVVSLFLAAALVASVGMSEKTPQSSLSQFFLSNAVANSPAELPFLEGTWAGTWTDTVFNVTGDMTFVIWAEGADYAATGSIDVAEIGFGLGVLNGGGTGVNNGGALDISFSCANLGDGTLVLTPVKDVAGSATATGAGTVTAPMNFGAFTLLGSATDTNIEGSFEFAGGGRGLATMTKTSVAVESQSWGNVKATYRDR